MTINMWNASTPQEERVDYNMKKYDIKQAIQKLI